MLPLLAGKGQLRGLAFDGYFIDIGVPEDLARARWELGDKNRDRESGTPR